MCTNQLHHQQPVIQHRDVSHLIRKEHVKIIIISIYCILKGPSGILVLKGTVAGNGEESTTNSVSH